MDEKELPQIKTYQGDVASAIKNQEESLVSIRSSELARKRATPLEPDNKAERTKNIIFFIVGILFILGGSVGGFLTYNTYKDKTAVPIVETPLNRFINIDSVKTVDVTGYNKEKLLQVVTEEKLLPLESGKVKQIQLRKGLEGSQLLPVTEFLLMFGTEAPPNFVRNLEKVFMLGLVGGVTPETFIILKTASFDNAFAGMLEWEESLSTEFLPLSFFKVPETATLPTFSDITIKNKDVRVLRSTTGEGVFYYTFYNQVYILITQSEEGLKTLLSRLDSASLKR